MFPVVMSNSNSLSEEPSVSSVTRVQDFGSLNPMVQTISSQQPQKIKKKRNLPGNPDPDAEVIALSPKTLLATNRFVCEICNKGFQRDQNLQLHRRGHNLPWKLKQRNTKENKKRAYVCPERSCIHHHPSRALGDLTGIKKHYSRKHGEKKWKCDKCSKIYAVQSDWKAHAKTCGTREYRCDCGTLFSRYFCSGNRKDSFITHRAFCNALAEESARLSANSILLAASSAAAATNPQLLHAHGGLSSSTSLSPFQTQQCPFPNPPTHISFNSAFSIPQSPNPNQLQNIKPETTHIPVSSPFYVQYPPPPPTTHKWLVASPFQGFNDGVLHHSAASNAMHPLSATALLQKAAALGPHSVGHANSSLNQLDMSNGVQLEYPTDLMPGNLGAWQKDDSLTRDFLGLTGDHHHQSSCGNGNIDVNVNVNMRGVVSFTGSVEFPTYERDFSSVLKHDTKSFGLAEPETWGNY